MKLNFCVGIGSRIVLVIGVLATFQFLHAFDPSGPFTVQIASTLNVTNRDIYTKVTTWRAWLLLPDTLLAGFTYEALGYRSSLIFLAATLLISVSFQALAVIIQKGAQVSLSLFQASYAISAFNFSAGFIVNCSMFSLLPPAHYQLASSANSIAMMIGSLLSSFIGQGLIHIIHNIGDLLFIGLGSIALSIPLVIFSVLFGALPPAPKVLTAYEWLSRVGKRLIWYHQHSQVLEWSVFNAIVLAIHSLVKGMWKSLFQDIDPTIGTTYNGFISAATCGAAALCMVLMALAPKATEKSARFVLCLFPFISSGLFAVMAISKKVIVAVWLLIAYNAACECALVLGSAMMGKSMAKADQIPEDIAPSATPETSTAINGIENETTSLIESQAKAKKLVDFTLVFTVNATVSILVQDSFNALAVYVFHLSSRGWFWGFGVVGCLLGISVSISSVYQCLKVKKKQQPTQ